MESGNGNGNGNEDVNMWEMKTGNGIYKWKWEWRKGNMEMETRIGIRKWKSGKENGNGNHNVGIDKTMKKSTSQKVWFLKVANMWKTYFSESDHFHDFHIIRRIIFSEMMLGIKIRIPKRKPAKWKTLKNVVKRMVFATSPEMKVREILLSEEFRLGTFHPTTIQFGHISKWVKI